MTSTIAMTVTATARMRIYNSVNIGEHGYIRVIGLDGSIRATSGRATSVLGQDFSSAHLFKRLSEAPNGWFYTDSFLSDNLPRLIAYRSVKDYPLIISVGFASHEIFSRLEALKQSGYLAAAVLTLLILIVTGLSVRGQWLRERAKIHMGTSVSGNCRRRQGRRTPAHCGPTPLHDSLTNCRSAWLRYPVPCGCRRLC